MTEPKTTGIACPKCECAVGNRVSHVWQRKTRWQGKEKTVTRRRKICRNCGLPFTTIETTEDPDRIGMPGGFRAGKRKNPGQKTKTRT